MITSSSTVGPRPTGWRVVFDRNYGPYLAGNVLSNIGTWIQTIAQTLLVWRLTGSTFLVGVIGFSQYAGVLFLGPWAGKLADRTDPRRLLLVTQLCAAGVSSGLGGLALAGLAGTAVVVASAVLIGFTTAFATPGVAAILPSLVTREQMPGAVALNSFTFSAARAVGPPIGAGVVAVVGLPWAFLINAGSFVAFMVALLVVTPDPEPRAPEAEARIRDSVRLVRADRRLLLLLLVVAAFAVSSDPALTLAPGVATELLGRSDEFTGVLIGAFGAGAMIAALASSQRRTTGYGLLSVATTGTGAGILAFATATTSGQAMVGLFLAGCGMATANTLTSTALQLEVDPRHRGRVMALWGIAFLGVRPVASLVDGALASLAGLRVAAAVLAVPTLVAGAVTALLFFRPRRLATRRPAGRGDVLVSSAPGHRSPGSPGR